MSAIAGDQGIGITTQADFEKDTIILVDKVIRAGFCSDSLAFGFYIFEQRRYRSWLERKLGASQNGPVFSHDGSIEKRTKLSAEYKRKHPGRIPARVQDAGNQYIGIQHNPGQGLPLADLISASIASGAIVTNPDLLESDCNRANACWARALRIALRLDSRLKSANGVRSAIGRPLLVIIISCSTGNCFQIEAGLVRRSLTVMNFIAIPLGIKVPCCHSIVYNITRRRSPRIQVPGRLSSQSAVCCW